MQFAGFHTSLYVGNFPQECQALQNQGLSLYHHPVKTDTGIHEAGHIFLQSAAKYSIFFHGIQFHVYGNLLPCTENNQECVTSDIMFEYMKR